MARVYVEITDRAANFKTSLQEVYITNPEITGAEITDRAGSFFGLEEGEGSFIYTAVDAFGEWLGLWGGRPTIREWMRDILYMGFNNALPGQVRKGRHDRPILIGQYPRYAIRAAIDEIGSNLLAQLPIGSDPFIDLSRAFSEIEFHDTDVQGWTEVLRFDEGVYAPETGNGVATNGMSKGKSALVGLGLIGLVASFSK